MRLLFTVLLLFFSVNAQSAESKSTITAEGIADLHVAQDVQISPDGTRVVFVVGQGNTFGGLRDTHLWIAPTDGSEPARIFASSENGEDYPRWSRNGKYIAFLSKRRADSKTEIPADVDELCIMPTTGGEAEVVTEFKGGVNMFAWSPDSKMIAFSASEGPTAEQEQKNKDKDDAEFVDHDYQFSRLWILNLADRKVRRVLKEDGNVNEISWSPDSSELAIKLSPTPISDDIYNHSKLVIVRASTGEINRTVTDTAGSTITRWSPDGKMIAFGKLSPAAIAEWHMVGDINGGNAQHVDDTYQGTIWSWDWMPDSKSMIAETIEGTRAKFVNINVSDGKISPVAEFNASYGDLSISSDGHKIAFQGEEKDSPPNIWIMESGQKPRRLTNFQPEVASWNVGSVQEINWKNQKDGKVIYGLLITPPGYVKGKLYPTVVQIHGGPEWSWWSGWLGSWHEWAQLLASNGYVVLMPNPRGSDGQNWRFIEANQNDWGGMDFEDIMSGVDYLVSEKIADPQKLGIGGWSYGGFMTSWVVTHTDRFKSAIVGAGVTDLISFNGTTDITPSFLKTYFAGTSVEKRDVYVNHSAMTFIQNTKTPTLVLHGEADERVPPGQGWEFYNSLKLLHVPTEMVTYPREHHGFHERLHQIDLLKRVLAWYDRYLK
ncbi:MAG: hypothetical protein C5B54_03180 [Acidobacteria bacterium]|nr:MAG: hypothetical protein C5B54_03180 [Acidobacteriota bacterium]